ncbi:internal scaffolding protein [Microvirus AZ-2020]|nr:internal scaffolding protein [Microvirus AZ-2020]
MSKLTTQSTATVDPETGEIQVESTIPYVFIRTPYNYDRKAASLETGTSCPEPTLTQQQFRDECDINVILERFGVTGELPTNVRQPIMADFIEALDYQDALNAIRAANEAFMEMPAGIRARFENNPHNFVEFFSKEENREEGVKLGLIEPKASLKQEAKDGQGGETPPQ